MTRLAAQLFGPHAAGKPALIARTLYPLAADFVRYAAPTPADVALDAGTGSGSVARLLASHVRHVTGLDVVRAPRRTANRNPAIQFVQADVLHPPFAAGVFTLITAHFGLNLTDPWRSLPALRRVLAARGRLVLQEWGPVAPVVAVVEDTLAEFAVDEPGERLARLRATLAHFPAPWNAQLQDVDDYRELCAELGFVVLDAAESTPVTIRLPHVAAFSAFMLAETVRAAEVAAMPDGVRAAFTTTLHARLAALAEPDGALLWRPVVFRITAQRAE